MSDTTKAVELLKKAIALLGDADADAKETSTVSIPSVDELEDLSSKDKANLLKKLHLADVPAKRQDALLEVASRLMNDDEDSVDEDDLDSFLKAVGVDPDGFDDADAKKTGVLDYLKGGSQEDADDEDEDEKPKKKKSDDEDEDEKPKKKKKSNDDDEESSDEESSDENWDEHLTEYNEAAKKNEKVKSVKELKKRLVDENGDTVPWGKAYLAEEDSSAVVRCCGLNVEEDSDDDTIVICRVTGSRWKLDAEERTLTKLKETPKKKGKKSDDDDED